MKDIVFGAVAGLAAGTVCFGISYILSVRFAPEGAYFGIGFQPWNLPGTILGLATFVGLIVWRNRNLKQ
jgi:hypothetical protein